MEECIVWLLLLIIFCVGLQNKNIGESAMENIKKNRQKIEVEYKIEPYNFGLYGTTKFWKSVINVYIELEIIPKLYRFYLHNRLKCDLPKSIKATNGSTVIRTTIYEDKMILTEAVNLKKNISREDAKEYGYEWYSTTLSLWIDKHFYFLKDYQEKKFDLSLIVPAYFKAKALMPSDRLTINDGTSKVTIAKKDGCTLVLIKGMRKKDNLWCQLFNYFTSPNK